MKILRASLLLCPNNERQWGINNCWPCISENLRAVRRHYSILMITASFLGKKPLVNVSTMLWKWASTQCWQFLALSVGKSKGCSATLTHHRTTSRLSRHKFIRQHHCHNLNLTVNRASTECQWFLLMQLAQSKGCASTYTHNQCVGLLGGHKC